MPPELPGWTILAAGIEQGVFRPTMSLDALTLALVAMEDGFTLQIVADRIITHDAALEVMRSAAASLGCPVLS
jgi:hypothetical protein